VLSVPVMVTVKFLTPQTVVSKVITVTPTGISAYKIVHHLLLHHHQNKIQFNVLVLSVPVMVTVKFLTPQTVVRKVITVTSTGIYVFQHLKE